MLRRWARQGTKATPHSRADDGRHRIGSDADLDRDDPNGREEGRSLAAAPARLGRARSGIDARPSRCGDRRNLREIKVRRLRVFEPIAVGRSRTRLLPQCGQTDVLLLQEGSDILWLRKVLLIRIQ
jgi:hypothetical protein